MVAVAFRETGCGVRGTGSGQLTAVRLAKLTAIHLRTYYKLTGARLELFHLWQGRSKEEERLGCVEGFAKVEWKRWHS